MWYNKRKHTFSEVIILEMKVCTSCKKEFPATPEFFHRRGKILKPKCKECRSKRKDKSQPRKSVAWVEDGKKLCTTCKRWLPADVEHFHRNSDGEGGLMSKCKECRGSNFGICRINKVLPKPEGFRYCSSCKQLFPESNFYHKKSQITSECKKCYSFNRNIQTRKRQEEAADYTVEQWNECMKHFGYKCAYCGKKRKLTQDHFFPRYSGGEYSTHNIVPACLSCNTSKNNHSFFEWYPTKDFCSEKREKKILSYLKIKDKVQQLEMIPR